MRASILSLNRLAALVAAGLFVLPTAALAQDEEVEHGWSDTAELAIVATAGNSETTTFGFKNNLTRTWERALFELNAGGIRVETTTTDRVAIGPLPGPPVVIEDENTDTTAESYFLNGRYNRKITDRFFWYTGLSWERNRFSGINNRYIASGGVGNIWRDSDDLKFRTDYALTYTDQEDVVETSGTNDTFAGVRLSWDYLNKFGDNTTYTNVLVVDGNFDETSDYRADMINAVSVAMSEMLALKVSLRWLYDNDPSFALVDRFDVIGGTPLAPFPVELDDLDTIFAASLVVNF